MTLAPASLGILQQIVLGSKVDEVPEELVERRFVRPAALKNRVSGYVKMVWVATKNGRLAVAQAEPKDPT